MLGQVAGVTGLAVVDNADLHFTHVWAFSRKKDIRKRGLFLPGC
jgi:hypothetical protein